MITSFSTLKTALSDLFEDTSTEFVDYTTTSIANAESRLCRDVDLNGIVLSTTINVTAGSNTFSRPSGYQAPHDFWYESGGSVQPLLFVTDGFIRFYWPNSSIQSAPKYVANLNESLFLLGPTPATNITVNLQYTGKPTALSDANPTNFFTTDIPDLLYQASIVEQAIWARNYQIIDLAESRYKTLLEGINNRGRRERRDDNKTTAITRVGAINTRNATE